MSVRVLLGMVMGMSSHGWLLLPDGDPDAVDAEVIDGMTKLGLWGMTRMREGAPGGEESTDEGS